LSEQLNALLAQEGTLAQVRRAEEGLSSNDLTTSPFAENTDTANQNQTTERGSISFWWQRARVPTDRRNASNLIGQIRVVPVWRQNAVMVVAPPEYKDSIIQLVNKLDRPGRQVLISAIVAEVSRDDATSLGIRWSSQAITPSKGDNSVNLGVQSRNTENNYATSLFDTSVLNVNTDVNVLLQALNEKTGVSILSEPKIFTSDNQEATFFDGQDIPFVTDSQTNAQGNLVQSFDYRAVGIQLRARPRITVQGDVDLRVNLELSSIVQGQTLFGGFIVDRRETTTQLIVQNRQTVVISGILREEDTNVTRKVPLLGDIPLVGELFKSRDTVRSNTELLVFITPIVVNNTQEATPVNESFVNRLRALREANRAQDKGKDKNDPMRKDRLHPGDDVPVLNAPADEAPAQPKE
jgi:general secretion pathway protein D